jgi:hypothetical protein
VKEADCIFFIKAFLLDLQNNNLFEKVCKVGKVVEIDRMNFNIYYYYLFRKFFI